MKRPYLTLLSYGTTTNNRHSLTTINKNDQKQKLSKMKTTKNNDKNYIKIRRSKMKTANDDDKIKMTKLK